MDLRQFITRASRSVHGRWLRIWGKAVLWWHGIRAPHVTCWGAPEIDLAPDSRIELGEQITLCSHSRYTALALTHPVHLRTLAKGAVIRIGARAGLSGTCVCAFRSVSIGADCLIGANVLIVDTDFHPLRAEARRTAPPSSAATAPVTIGTNVFIGAHSIILKGVTIGDDAVIGAGSVVSRDVPAGAIFAGNPARLVRALRP